MDWLLDSDSEGDTGFVAATKSKRRVPPPQVKRSALALLNKCLDSSDSESDVDQTGPRATVVNGTSTAAAAPASGGQADPPSAAATSAAAAAPASGGQADQPAAAATSAAAAAPARGGQADPPAAAAATAPARDRERYDHASAAAAAAGAAPVSDQLDGVSASRGEGQNQLLRGLWRQREERRRAKAAAAPVAKPAAKKRRVEEGRSGGAAAGPATAGPARGVVHNVKGVEGLSIAYNLWGEAFDRKLWEGMEPTRVPGCPPSWRLNVSGMAYDPANAVTALEERTPSMAGTFGLEGYPADFTKVLNAARDAGLLDLCVTPDRCNAYAYENGIGFPTHFDSKYTHGECLVVASCGSGCTLQMQKHNGGNPLDRRGEITEVFVPSRSVYVMRGKAREYGKGNWKHGVKSQTAAELEIARSSPDCPHWNPGAERRALVFRPSKAFTLWALSTGSGAALGLTFDVPPEQLKARKDAQAGMPWQKSPEANALWAEHKRAHPNDRSRAAFLAPHWENKQAEAARLGAALEFSAYGQRLGPEERVV